MSLTIHVASEKRLRKEKHPHRCPICKKVRIEENEVCQKTLAGTGLPYHSFPCILCSNDWRARFGQDAVTAYLTEFQSAMLAHVWPNQQVAGREMIEAARGDEDARAVIDLAKKI